MQLDYKERLLARLDGRHYAGRANGDCTGKPFRQDANSDPVPDPQRHPAPDALGRHLCAERHTPANTGGTIHRPAGRRSCGSRHRKSDSGRKASPLQSPLCRRTTCSAAGAAGGDFTTPRKRNRGPGGLQRMVRRLTSLPADPLHGGGELVVQIGCRGGDGEPAPPLPAHAILHPYLGLAVGELV